MNTVLPALAPDVAALLVAPLPEMYACKRCKQSFTEDGVWRTGKRFICRTCARGYKKEHRVNENDRLERALGRAIRDMQRLQYRGKCLACGEHPRAHRPSCPVGAVSAICRVNRGYFSPTVARVQDRDHRFKGTT